MIREGARGRVAASASRPVVSVVSSNEGPEIDALVDRARNGDAEAFGELYDRFAPRVHRYVLFRVRVREDAEDLVQRIFLKAMEALPRYERRGVPFGAWLFRLAHNAVIDFGRTHRDHQPLEDAAAAAGSDDPEDAASRSEEVRELRGALGRLTADQRHVIALRFFAGLDTRDAARVLGRREIAVRALQFRALAALRRELTAARPVGRPGAGR